MKRRQAMHRGTLLLWMLLPLVAPGAARAAAAETGAVQTASTAARFAYTQLPQTAVFADWNKLGSAGWRYFGTFGNAIVFRQDGAAAHERWAFAQLPLLASMSDWNVMGSQGWQYVSIFQKTIILCRKTAAEGQPAPPEAWEYIQLRPAAPTYEWNDLGEQGWVFAGEFMKALVFMRTVTGAATPPAKPRVAWEYVQLSVQASFTEWNALGAKGWDLAGILKDAIVFKRPR